MGSYGAKVAALKAPAKATVRKYAVSIPSKVVDDTLVVDQKGDSYANAMYKEGSGYYAKLKSNFNAIKQLAITSKSLDKMDSGNVKKYLKAAKDSAGAAANSITSARSYLESNYNLTKDIYNAKNRSENVDQD